MTNEWDESHIPTPDLEWWEDESPIQALAKAIWAACSDGSVMHVHVDGWKELGDIATDINGALRASGWRLDSSGVSDDELADAFAAVRACDKCGSTDRWLHYQDCGRYYGGAHLERYYGPRP